MSKKWPNEIDPIGIKSKRPEQTQGAIPTFIVFAGNSRLNRLLEKAGANASGAGLHTLYSSRLVVDTPDLL